MGSKGGVYGTLDLHWVGATCSMVSLPKFGSMGGGAVRTARLRNSISMGVAVKTSGEIGMEWNSSREVLKKSHPLYRGKKAGKFNLEFTLVGRNEVLSSKRCASDPREN